MLKRIKKQIEIWLGLRFSCCGRKKKWGIHSIKCPNKRPQICVHWLRGCIKQAQQKRLIDIVPVSVK
jgi:hypothetical protein